eukprot:TRINITY_DN57346_c0_g1_i1.p1 TRINITY_DN57346_c0_g1~~TRINITY_DN57346_c0_g1_i1.p1  ORF type:complete len:636 (-),score=111.77 TRINITY_DN57346_c0_g1_i1:312-2219(-)
MAYSSRRPSHGPYGLSGGSGRSSRGGSVGGGGSSRALARYPPAQIGKPTGASDRSPLVQKDGEVVGQRASLQKDEESILSTGLTFRDLDGKAVRCWLAFQLVGLFFQYSLWSEVRGHLDTFEAALEMQCGKSGAAAALPGPSGSAFSAADKRILGKLGICAGPMWNLAALREVSLEGHNDWEGVSRRRGYDHYRGYSGRSRSGFLMVDGPLPESIDGVNKEIKQLQDETAARLKVLQERKQLLEKGLPLPKKTLSELLQEEEDARELADPNTTLSFNFSTRSSPPTFLVAVEPVSQAHRLGEAAAEVPDDGIPKNLEAAAALEEIRWSLQVERIDPPARVEFGADSTGGHAWRRRPRVYSGLDVVTFEDLSPEAVQSMASKAAVTWTATLTSRSRSARQTRFVAYVEDSAVPHLSAVHAASKCSFTKSWKEFNLEHQGRGHQTLSFCRTMLGWSLLVTIAFAALLHQCIFGAVGNDCCEGYGFHSVLLAKFAVVDIAQQVCIVLYLLGWYEASGLRCQLCLFHPSHCEEEHPFKMTNSIAFLCTLLSSIANQLLFRPSYRRKATEEDDCCMFTSRLSALCVSTLPFSTGVFFASSAILPSPLLIQVMLGIPCLIGWMTLVIMFMGWCHACCSECN